MTVSEQTGSTSLLSKWPTQLLTTAIAHTHARALSLFAETKKIIDILSEAKKSLFATSPPKQQEARAGTSRPMERFMAQFAPREGDQSQSGYRPPASADDLAIPPLMEGMGEVDTGAF